MTKHGDRENTSDVPTRDSLFKTGLICFCIFVCLRLDFMKKWELVKMKAASFKDLPNQGRKKQHKSVQLLEGNSLLYNNKQK